MDGWDLRIPEKFPMVPTLFSPVQELRVLFHRPYWNDSSNSANQQLHCTSTSRTLVDTLVVLKATTSGASSQAYPYENLGVL